MLDEVAAGDMGLELLGGQEVVVDAVALAGPRPAGGRRDRQLEAGDALEQPTDQRALPHAGRTGDHEDLAHRREPARGDAVVASAAA